MKLRHLLALCAVPSVAAAQPSSEPRPLAPSSPGATATAEVGLRPIAEEEAVREAIAENPNLRAAMLDLARGGHVVAAEEDRYPLTLQLEGGATHSETPQLASNDLTTISARDNVDVASQLSKQFAWGTNVALRLEGGWARTQFPPLPQFPDQIVSLGPGWSLLARLSVAQPLLRGAGTDVGEAELRAAELQKDAAEHARDRAASELMRDVVVSFWELWFAGEAEAIERAARTLAEDERAATQARIDEGALAAIEITTFDTRVLELEEAVNLARLERRRRALELGGRLGRRGARALGLVADAEGPPPLRPPPPRRQLVKAALAASPQLRELEAQIALERDRARIAGEQDRQRLDLEGWLQTQGLGNGQVPPALEQAGTFEAFSAHIGLVYELPLTGSRYDSQQAASHAAIEAAEARRDAIVLTIEQEVDLQRERAVTAVGRVALAERTVEAAARQLTAARDRYAEGDGLPLEIERAEDALRRAKQRALRARVDATQADTALQHLTGELLRRYRGLVEGARPRGRAGWAGRSGHF